MVSNVAYHVPVKSPALIKCIIYQREASVRANNGTISGPITFGYSECYIIQVLNIDEYGSENSVSQGVSRQRNSETLVRTRCLSS